MRFHDFPDHLNADRRLELLRALESSAQYRGNAFLLRSWCDRRGHVVGMDVIARDLAALAGLGLVELAHEGEVMVATLTVRGLDVATGRTEVPGVAKPAPGY